MRNSRKFRSAGKIRLVENSLFDYDDTYYFVKTDSVNETLLKLKNFHIHVFIFISNQVTNSLNLKMV